MPITTVGIGAAVTPTVIKTYLSHYADRKPRRQKPTAHIAYDEGLHLIRSFLEYASHHTVEDLQSFTAQWVPSPSWVRTENVLIPEKFSAAAAESLVTQLGLHGVQEVGGQQWWQWRAKNADLKAEWVEMRADYNARKQLQEKCKRVMLYVHGGAYFFGSVDEHRYQLQRHARKLKARVFAPRYRLAPQYPFPCGLQDCLASYLYLLSLHDPTEIILAGDSAGGGMVLSMLCMLRDQELPLPAGAVLISPWVDLTHSFPSVAGDGKADYIPAHGFMQKPSASWPPPNDDDMAAINKGAGEGLIKEHHKLEKKSVVREQAQGVKAENPTNGAPQLEKKIEQSTEPTPKVESKTPGPTQHLSIDVDGKKVELRDQIQMYTTNQLISHPLVSPVLQPSLGGLPPLLIMTGGGEVLRDEQIYVAHKAANPTKYPLGAEYQARYDPKGEILNKYKPTYVQLQVWEDLCHVAPTLSFTRPAKFMYRSIAQFGAWALARAQNTSIELVDDDNISVISHSGSDSESERSVDKEKAALARRNTQLGAIGKAGDAIPNFRNHMIRQRVNRHGVIYPLDPVSELAALQLKADDVGVIKIGPVKKWMDARKIWDTKYARATRRVQQKRIKDLTRKKNTTFPEDERPPPSALAGRQHEAGEMITTKLKKSFYLAMWSGWGSKHDEDTIKREQDYAKETEDEQKQVTLLDGSGDAPAKTTNRNETRSRKISDPKNASAGDRSRSRRKTVSVRDQGQTHTNGEDEDGGSVAAEVGSRADAVPVRNTTSTDDSHLQPVFLPKFKNQGHLRGDSRDISDSASVRTGISALSVPDNASTMAVFSAAGVSKRNDGLTINTTKAEAGDPSTNLSRTGSAGSISTIRQSKRPESALSGYDTPVSRRSVERLMSHQVEVTGPDGEAASVLSADATSPASVITNGVGTTPTQLSASTNKHLSRIQMNRNISSTAVVQVEGVVGVVKGGNVDQKAKSSETLTKHESVNTATEQSERPALYDRQDSEFQTAQEVL